MSEPTGDHSTGDDGRSEGPPRFKPRPRRRGFRRRALSKRLSILLGELTTFADRFLTRNPPKTAVLMMQKNEHLLLEFWFRYHAEVFGAQNLFVFDNGSTDPAVIALLDRIEAEGCQVIREFSDAASFHEKGMVLLRQMNALRREGYRMFIPLDCDEFVAVRTEAGPSIDPAAIRAELRRCLAAPAYAIGPCLNNNLSHPARYNVSQRRKVFGTFRGLRRLECGYHKVKVRTGRSALFYFHYHFRPFADLQAKAAAKLAGHGVDLAADDLRRYEQEGRRGGRFNVRYLFMTEEAYLRRHVAMPGEECRLLHDWFMDRLGRVPFPAGAPAEPAPAVT